MNFVFRDPTSGPRKHLCLCFAVGLWIVCQTAVSSSVSAATYYIDSHNGADGNSGLSSAQSWKTLTKVNATTFVGGDRILFSAGGRWEGKLNPKGSGASGNPIVIDRYGDGPLPVIDGAGSTGDAVVYLYNSSTGRSTTWKSQTTPPPAATAEVSWSPRPTSALQGIFT